MNQIYVSMLPAFAEQSDLHGQSAVVIDVLRASTTIVHALAHGAAGVRACSSVKQARDLADSLSKIHPLLGGERHCQKIEGFDLDNSPLNYTSSVVKDRELIFTSTNGTYALERCRDAADVFIGCFVNLSAVAEALIAAKRPVHLVCAGTNRQLTAEDILFAGALIDQLMQAESPAFEVADLQAQMVWSYYEKNRAGTSQFRKAIYGSLGAENLLKLGMNADIDRASKIDLFEVVPQWNIQENRLLIH